MAREREEEEGWRGRGEHRWGGRRTQTGSRREEGRVGGKTEAEGGKSRWTEKVGDGQAEELWKEECGRGWEGGRQSKRQETGRGWQRLGAGFS